MDERITKIKTPDEATVHLEWDRPKLDGEPDLYRVTCHEKARPAFYETLESLCLHVAAMCELDDGWAEEMEIVGVSFSENDEQGLGVVFTVTKKLVATKAPIRFSTPHVCERGAAPDDAYCMSPDMVELLRTLQKEAREYIAGERNDENLFSKTEEQRRAA